MDRASVVKRLYPTRLHATRQRIQEGLGAKVPRHKGGIMKCQSCHCPILPDHPSMNHGTFHARCYFAWINELETRH